MSIGKAVLVRTYSAGVHFGTLIDRRGKEVDLARTKRVWSWKGANTLNELALHGPDKGSRISEAITRNTLLEAIEILECSEEAIAAFAEATWSK